MSWGIAVTGNTPAIATEIDKEFSLTSKSPEPEETLKQAARKLIRDVITAQSPGTKLKITAWGNQTNSEQKSTNSFGINVEVVPFVDKVHRNY